MLKGLSYQLNGTKGFLIFCFTVTTAFYSCDESSVIGLDIQPANDLLRFNFLDTTTVVTRTIKMDSLLSDVHVPTLLSTGTLLLGTYQDPVFGKTSNSIYTQLSLTTNNPNFGSSPQVDSVVLSMVYDPSYYGKTQMANQTVSVYRLTGDINSSSYYYSSDSIAYDYLSDLAGSYTFRPAPLDSVTIMGSTGATVLKPQIRIPISNSLGAELLAHQTDLVSSSSLQAFMKGLFITTQNSSPLSGDGNLLKMHMTDPQSRLTVYYSSGSGQSQSYDFSLAGAGRFSRFKHDYSSADASIQAQLASSSGNNNRVFIQGTSGLKVKVDFPYIMDWLKEGAIAINKAELVVKIDQDPLFQKDTFSVPLNLVVFGIYDDGTNYALPLVSGDPGMDGSYNSSTLEYHFNLTRYVQELLIGKAHNNGLHMLVASGAYYPNRVVIGGGDDSGSLYQMKLNLSYTKLE